MTTTWNMTIAYFWQLTQALEVLAFPSGFRHVSGSCEGALCSIKGRHVRGFFQGIQPCTKELELVGIAATDQAVCILSCQGRRHCNAGINWLRLTFC